MASLQHHQHRMQSTGGHPTPCMPPHPPLYQVNPLSGQTVFQHRQRHLVINELPKQQDCSRAGQLQHLLSSQHRPPMHDTLHEQSPSLFPAAQCNSRVPIHYSMLHDSHQVAAGTFDQPANPASRLAQVPNINQALPQAQGKTTGNLRSNDGYSAPLGTRMKQSSFSTEIPAANAAAISDELFSNMRGLERQGPVQNDRQAVMQEPVSFIRGLKAQPDTVALRPQNPIHTASRMIPTSDTCLPQYKEPSQVLSNIQKRQAGTPSSATHPNLQGQPSTTPTQQQQPLPQLPVPPSPVYKHWAASQAGLQAHHVQVDTPLVGPTVSLKSVLQNNVSNDGAGRSMAQYLADWQRHTHELYLSARNIQQQTAPTQHVQEQPVSKMPRSITVPPTQSSPDKLLSQSSGSTDTDVEVNDDGVLAQQRKDTKEKSLKVDKRNIKRRHTEADSDSGTDCLPSSKPRVNSVRCKRHKTGDMVNMRHGNTSVDPILMEYSQIGAHTLVTTLEQDLDIALRNMPGWHQGAGNIGTINHDMVAAYKMILNE